MPYEVNGKALPKVVLGSWAWGTGMNGSRMIFGTTTDKEELKKVYIEGKKLGLVCWDTAAIYGMGNSEQLLGEFSEKDSTIISTKYIPNKKFSEERIDQSLSDSITRLKGKKPDIYWLHNPKQFEKNLNYFCRLLDNKEVGSIGVCNASIDQVILAEELLSQRGYHLAGVQDHFSLLYRRHERERLIDWCKVHGVPFFSYMTLEQGALTGRFNGRKGFPAFSRRAIAFPKRRLKKIEPLLNELEKVGSGYGLTIAQTAIAWAICKGTVPIIGVTKTYQVKDLEKVMQVTLKEKDIKRLDEIAEKTGVEVAASWE